MKNIQNSLTLITFSNLISSPLWFNIMTVGSVFRSCSNQSDEEPKGLEIISQRMNRSRVFLISSIHFVNMRWTTSYIEDRRIHIWWCTSICCWKEVTSAFSFRKYKNNTSNSLVLPTAVQWYNCNLFGFFILYQLPMQTSPLGLLYRCHWLKTFIYIYIFGHSENILLCFHHSRSMEPEYVPML